MSSLKCLIVDDEELARRLIASYIERIEGLTLVAAEENAVEALSILDKDKIDIAFLDIQMPELSGTQLAKLVPDHTHVIFTTGYSEYALEGFELEATDYLLKPITFERFYQAVQKVKKPKTSSKTTTDTTITVKSGYDLFKVTLSDILYIKSDSEYIEFYLPEQKIVSHYSLKKILEALPENDFMRVHRSYIINKHKVTGLKGKDLMVNGTAIPVSVSYMDIVKETLFT